MENRKVKKSVLVVGYGLVLVLFIGAIFLIENAISNSIFKENKDYKYVNETILEEEIPVVTEKIAIIKPYTDKNVKEVKGFYDYKDDSKKQQSSILFYKDTYLQNSGIEYGGVEKGFDVVSILDGTVVTVKQDEILGNIVEIKHTNDMIGVYQSLSNVTVKKDDTIKQGQIIAKSGESNIGKDLKSHLHFELIFKGQTVNPSDYYDKLISDL